MRVGSGPSSSLRLDVVFGAAATRISDTVNYRALVFSPRWPPVHDGVLSRGARTFHVMEVCIQEESRKRAPGCELIRANSQLSEDAGSERLGSGSVGIGR